MERGKLLRLMGRAEAAEEQMEQAAALLTAELASWRVADQQGGLAAGAGQATGQTTGGAAADAAGEAGQAEAASGAPGAAGTARGRAAASAALSTLLDVASMLRQLGREARANELLTGAVATAPALGSANSYLRGLAQLSKLTGGHWDDDLSGWARPAALAFQLCRFSAWRTRRQQLQQLCCLPTTIAGWQAHRR